MSQQRGSRDGECDRGGSEGLAELRHFGDFDVAMASIWVNFITTTLQLSPGIMVLIGESSPNGRKIPVHEILQFAADQWVNPLWMEDFHSYVGLLESITSYPLTLVNI